MISVSTNILDYGKITVGNNSSKLLTVFNDNDTIDVNITVISSNSVYVSVPTSVLIPANGSIILTVTFEPDSESSFSETLTISNDDSGDLGDDIVNLLGEGVKAQISVSEISLSFGDVSVDDTKQLTFEVEHSGIDGILKVTDISSDNALFDASSKIFNLNPSEKKIITVDFSPIAAGSETGTLTVVNNSSNDTSVDILVDGAGVEPTIDIDVTSINFGNVTVNDSKTENVKVTNISTSEVNLLITQVSTNNSKFTETVTSAILAKDEFLDIPVTFSPTDSSTQLGVLTIESNSAVGINTVNLEGDGIIAPNIDIDTSDVDFGEIFIGQTKDKILTITNIGVLDLNITSISTDNVKFTVDNSSTVIAPTDSFDLTITYVPNSIADDVGVLTIVSDDPDTPSISINLLGKASALNPRIEVETSDIDFERLGVSQTRHRTLTISNTGVLNLDITSISTDNVKFTVDSSSTIIVPTDSFDLTITYITTEVAIDTGILTIISNDPDTPSISINLLGEALAADIIVSLSTLDYGKVTVGESSTKAFTIFNQVNAIVDVTITSNDSSFIPNQSLISINPNSSAPVNVTFTPNDKITYVKELTVASNDTSDPDELISLLGQGIEPIIQVSPTALDFDSVGISDTKQLSIIVKNINIEGILKVTDIISNEPTFSISPTSFSLNPQQSKTVNITFSPLEAAVKIGKLVIFNNSDENEFDVDVQGEGIVPTISIDKTSLDFDEVTINTSKILDVIVSNISAEDVNIVISDVSTNNIRFKESITTFVIAKDSALNIPVTFTPVDTSTQSGKLTITSNAGVNEIDLSGKGTATPNISVSTDFLNFGKIGLGNSSSKKFTISNSGVVDLNVSQIFSDNTKFVVLPLSTIIPPSGLVEFTVIYSPVDPIVDSGTLLIVSNDPDTPNVSVNVGGEGVSPSLQTATNLRFGNIAVGSTSSQSLTISNPESADLIISSVTFSNSKFSTSETFPITINASSSKNLTINFTPDSVGTETGDLTLFSNDFDNPETVVDLDGIGTVPNIAINPSSINFGNLIINGTRERSIVVSNVGEASLVISSISISNSVFSTNLSSFTVEPGLSQNLDITFSPISLGSQIGTVTLINNDPDEPNLIIDVQGVGGKPIISVDKTSILFGGTAINTTLNDQVVVTNSGIVDLEINNAINPPGMFGVTPESRVISPSTSEILSVTFTPTVLSSHIAHLNIGTNDADNAVVPVELKGSGIQVPSIRLSSSLINFPETIAGRTSSNALGVTNAGSADLVIETITIASNPTFVVTVTPPITITPGNSTSITIIFTPSAAGSFSTTMTLTTNDPNNQSVDVELTGTATAAILAWEDFDLDDIVPEQLITIANKVNEVIGPITEALEFINSILEIVKAFIVDKQDPVKVALEAIKVLLEKLINDIAATGLYFLQIFPGDFKIGPSQTPQYLLGVPIDLSDPDNLPKKIKDKYQDQIDAGITFVTADITDIQLIFGPTEDFFNNIKGGSLVFKNKILQSFDDPGDSKRPQFSDIASAGAIILAVDTGDLTTILKLLKKIADILKKKFEAQFLPPTNVTAIAGNSKVRITFSPNDALLPNAWILWRSEEQSGETLFDNIPIKDSDKTEKVSKKDKYGNVVKRYKLLKVITLQDQLAEIFNVSKESANSMVKNAFGYIRGLLGNAEQFFSAKFTTEDDTVTNGKNYYYVLTAASVADPNDTSEITNIVGYSDEIVWIEDPSNEQLIREINPFDVGLFANSTYSTEVSASPGNAFAVVEGSLARCRNYRCAVDKEETETFTVIANESTIIRTLKNEPLLSTMIVTMERNTGTTNSVVDIPQKDYNVKGKKVSFIKTGFFEKGDKIIIKYNYREILKTKSIKDEQHPKSLSNATTVTLTLKNTPIVTDLSKIFGTVTSSPSVSITSKKVIDPQTGKIELGLSGSYTGNAIFKANYDYYVNFGTDQNFRCINPEFAKYYFDVVKCDNGTTLCPGYENRSCFFNDGEGCTNTGTSSRRITVIDVDGLGRSTGRKVSQPENVEYKNFWDPFYCQNGIMAQRCDGYSIGAPRAGYKGVPPDWSRIAIIDLFPDIKDLIKLLNKFIDSLLDGTTKVGDTLIAFINLIQRKIQGLQKFLALIQNIIDMLTQNFSGGGFYLLKVPIGEGGNAYLKESISKATGGPSSDAFGYTGGIVIVYGGPGGATLEAALDIFF